MIIQKFLRLSFLLLFAVQTFQDCETGFDYESKPEMPYKIENTEINATISSDDNRVKGVVNYTLRTTAPNQHAVQLNAAELAINSVTANDDDVDFAVNDEVLEIFLNDTLALGETTDISITWQAESNFGVHKNHLGTVWSSQNPKALRHWLPTFDHSRAESKITAQFNIPADKDIVFNGKLIADEIVSSNQKEVTWQSQTPMPLTGLGFVIGKFDKKDTFSGSKKIQVFAEKGTVDDEKLDELLNTASSTIRNVENKLSYQYPYEVLNIVVLNDSYWEEKQTGAGIAYIYTDLDNVQTQLKRNIYGQWFGEYQRLENFVENVSIVELLKVVLHLEIEDNPVVLNNEEDMVGIYAWNAYTENYTKSDGFFKGVIYASIGDLIKKHKGVISPDLYPDYWYNMTGLNFVEFDIWDENEEIITKDESPFYIVEADYDETNSMLTLNFEANSGDYSILSGLDMHIHTFSDEITKEISFTGKSDEVKMEIPVDTDYITFSSSVTDLEQVEFGKFPIVFLLNQLADDDKEARAMAAEQLSYHLEDSDLQLALTDALSFEKEPEVRAKLLYTYSLFTNGATGTDQTFIKEVNNENTEIQKSVLKALGNFPENEYVSSTLQTKMLDTNDEEIFEIALISYQNITDLETMISFAKSLSQKSDNSGKLLKTIQYILDSNPESVAELGSEMELLLEYNQPYTVRRKALDLWVNQSQKDATLNKIAQDRIEDRDPRIRHYIVKNVLDLLNEKTKQELVEQLKLKEYDPRVY